MQRRAQHLGASFSLHAQPGQGTRIRLTLPASVLLPPPPPSLPSSASTPP
jgi:signal transduction histidine kinase